MRTFFSRIFMGEELLNEARIYYPIKLEYYKIVNEEETIEESKAKYGVNIVKTEYKKDGVKVENEKVEHISNNENEIDEILNILTKNEVTPVVLEDVLNDILNS